MFTSFTELLERTLPSRESVCADSRTAVSKNSKRFPLAIVLDSIPSTGRNKAAPFVAGMKPSVMKTAVLISATLLMSAIFCSYKLLRIPQPFSTMNAQLLRGDVIPRLSNYFTPRLYIYSEGDEIVDYREVEAHLRVLVDAVEEERRKEIEPALKDSSDTILVEKFGSESVHVMHVRSNSLRYWDAVDRLWKKALNMRSDPLGHFSYGVKPKL